MVEVCQNKGKSPVKTTPPMELGRHLNDPIGRNCLDRISSLPDELLGHMLSFLPTTFAVTTSILSTRWRHLFTLTTRLSFEDKPLYSYLIENERIAAPRRFKEYVDKVLELHQMSPIKKFSLVCYVTYNDSDLNRWFTNALQKDVQELHYQLNDQRDYVPNHDGFFMCKTLVSLKMQSHLSPWLIGNYYKIEIPPSPSLPKLKILHLDFIIFFDFESIERLFSSCELLENLTLRYCKCHIGGHALHRTRILKELTINGCSFLLGTFEIDAPNLLYLEYKSNIGVRIIPSWKDSCSLELASLTFSCSADDSAAKVDLNREILEAAASKAVHLSFETDSLQLLLRLDAENQMPDYSSLSTLYIIGHYPYNAWEYITCLLEKCPQLEVVRFESGLHCCECSEYECPDDCYFSLPALAINLVPFACHVKKIQVFSYCGHGCSLSLMGHLLKSASVLEEVDVYTNIYDDDDEEYYEYNVESEKLKICMDLLRLPRASKDCCIEIRD